MPPRLQCQSAPHVGKFLDITSEKPVTIKTQKADQEVGDVRVELIDGAVVLTSRSQIRCTVNDVPQTRSMLRHDDLLTIGKQSFRVVIEDDQDASKTQSLSLDDVASPAPPQLCSVCDKVFDDQDLAHGWTSGDRRICRRCLSKGVRPGNLPDPGAVPADLVPESAPAQSAPPSDSDAVNSESDRHRRQRRLSASRLAQIESPGKPGLFSKVGQVFSNREERRRLETLEQERRSLLEAAGRLALTDRNGFGVPDHLIPPLSKGVSVTLRPADFSLSALERWRSVRSRLTFLDAEIAALRNTLQLGPDPGTKLPEEPLRSDQEARQNRTFAMLDSMPTMDLEGEAGLADETEVKPGPAAKAQPPVPAQSGRRKSLRRRH